MIRTERDGRVYRFESINGEWCELTHQHEIAAAREEARREAMARRSGRAVVDTFIPGGTS